MLSSSGFHDGLGDRDLLFDRESGEVRERLFPRPELAAYEAALRSRIRRLAAITDPRLVPVVGIEHDRATGRLAVVSRHVSGTRIADTLRFARERELIPDLTVSLFLAAEIFAAVHAFHALSRVPHGAINTNSVITTIEGEVMLADYAYAEVIESARFAPRRLWREFSIAQWLGDPFSVAGDVHQAALVSIALMLGRPLDEADLPEGLDELVSEVEEAAMIRGGRLFAEPVVTWLIRALGQTRDAFNDSAAAAAECVKLLTERERASARPALVQFLAELEAPPVPLAEEPDPAFVSTEPDLGEAPTPEAYDGLPLADSATPGIPEPESFPPSGFEFSEEVEPRLSTPKAQELECAPEPVPAAEVEEERVAVAEPAPANTPEPEPVPAPEPRPETASPGFFSPQPDGRAELDRSAPETPASAPTGAPAFDTNAIVSPSPFAAGQQRSQPRITPPAPAPPFVVPPPIPPLPRSPFAPVVDVAPLPPAAPVTRESPPIRLKEPEPSKQPQPRRHIADRPAPNVESAPEEPKTGFRIPWKIAAAAAIVLATLFAAVTVDWSTTGEAAPPPGTLVIETTPPGSDVFVDGAAKGVTPAVLQVTPGRHEIKVRRKGAEHGWSVDIASSARRVERLDWTALHQTGAIEVISNAAGSKVMVDGKLRGVTPVVIADLKPGRHTVLVQGPNGNVRRRVTVVAGETTKLDLAIYSGWIIVSAPIELQVVEKGRTIGNAGDGPIVLSAGPHAIELVNETLAYRSAHTIDIAPGEEERVTVAPKGAISVNAIPWAEVWLDGHRVGETPIAKLEVPLGACELVLKHPEHGERRMAVTVTGAAPAEVTVDFTSPSSP